MEYIFEITEGLIMLNKNLRGIKRWEVCASDVPTHVEILVRGNQESDQGTKNPSVSQFCTVLCPVSIGLRLFPWLLPFGHRNHCTCEAQW